VIRYFFSVLNSHQLSFTGFAAALAAGLPPASNRTPTTEVQTRLGRSKAKTVAASTHIPCGSQANVLEEAHGICVMALPFLNSMQPNR
jgi:hypothetical protein